MKKIMMIMLAGLLVLSFSSCSKSKETKAKVLKMSITSNENSSWYKAALKLNELIKEGTEGRYSIDVYPNEQLSGGSPAKGIENVQNGVTDVDLRSTIIYTIADPKFTVVSMPWMIPTFEEADSALNGKGGEAIFELARENGVVPLAFGESGYRQMTNNSRPIKTPEDFTGLKFRVPGIKMFLDLYSEFGADPTAMNFAEVFTALQQGTIDGQENPVDVVYDFKLNEVQKYLTISNYVYDALLLSVSENIWKKLSDEDKAVFQSAANEAMAYQKSLARDDSKGYLSQLEGEMEVNVLTPKEIAVFQEAVKPIYSKWEEILGLDLMMAFGYQK